MARIKKLIEGYRRFYRAHFIENRDLYTELATKGQFPKTLVIACSDSRVDPSIVLDAGPGDIFVIRNVANLVPPCQPDSQYHGTSAALEFGVNHLKVENIIVFGHGGCAGIQTLLDFENPRFESDFIHNWVDIARDARLETLGACDREKTQPGEAQRHCEHAAIHVSLRNLMTFPWIREKVEDGRLKLHGWHFDIDNGTLERWNDDTHAFEIIPGVEPA